MKQGWTYKKLGDIAIITHGKNQKDVISEDGQYPIYGSGGNIMGYATDYLCEANTTILGRKGSINNPQFISERFWNVDTAFGIFAKNDNDSKFIYYFIKSIKYAPFIGAYFCFCLQFYFFVFILCLYSKYV